MFTLLTYQGSCGPVQSNELLKLNTVFEKQMHKTNSIKMKI